MKEPITERTKKKAVALFSKQRRPMTVADIAAGTGCALHEIAAVMPDISDEFGARLQVTESGELLYAFPHGMKSRYTGFKPFCKKALSAFFRFLKKAGTLLFKIWIAVMLIGYVIIFVLLILAAVVLTFAASAAGDKNNSRKRDSGISGVLLIRLLDFASRVLFYSAVIESDRSNAYRAQKSKAEKRPLHVSVFSFVFGEPDPQIDIDSRIQKSVIAYIRNNKGAITLPEFIIITEFPPLTAEREILRFLKDYHGEPVISENGTIIYNFPELMTSQTAGESGQPVFAAAERAGVVRQLQRFSKNAAKTNRVYCILNAFNLLLGSYFMIQTGAAAAGKTAVSFLYGVTNIVLSAFLPSVNAAAVTGIGLGVMPVAFSILFFLIPAIRKLRNNKINERIKTENLRSVIYNQIWQHPENFKPSAIVPNGELIKTANRNAPDMLAREAGNYFGMDIDSNDTSVYTYPAIKETREDISAFRTALNTAKYDTGDVVFDSGL